MEETMEDTMELDELIIDEMTACRSSQSSNLRQKLAASILARPEEEIISLLKKRSEGPNPWQAILDFVRALFYGLGPLAKEDETSNSAKLLQSTFVSVVNLVHGLGSTADSKLAHCVSFLMQEMETFPKSLLPPISESIISVLEIGEQVEDGLQYCEGSVHHLLELLPRCLALVGSASSVQLTGQESQAVEMTGIQYRETVLTRLLAIRWSKKFVTRMASLLRDLSLTMREMEQFVRKLFLHMKDAEPQDLPSLVYQLLLLASKGYKRIVLSGMINFFNKKHVQESTLKGRASSNNAAKLKSMDAFRQMEGTIVLHINFAVKQDPALGQEFLYLVRVNSWPLTPFLVSVLLSIGRIQRFEQPAFDLLRTAAVKCFKDCHQCRESRWAAAILGTACFQTAGRVQESFMRTVQSNAFGWDHIIPSVVRMGFTLIESVGPGRPSSKVEDPVRPSEQSSDTQELGIQILSAAFDVHELARDEIIEQCKCRIIGRKPQHSAPILRMIVQLVQDSPYTMLGHSRRLKECLDYFTFLHPSSASSLIAAISPLFQMSSDLQDYTVLVLRKEMFGREETSRMTAVQGLLDLIVSGKRPRPSDSVPARDRFSEASCSQSSSQIDRNLGRPGSLLQDLLGLLRRCLSQQVGVREKLYQGLPKLLEVDPEAADAVFDLIWPHFSRYYVSEPDQPASLKLDLCVSKSIDGVRVAEPLDHLISCIHQLLVQRPQLGLASANSCNAFGLPEPQDQELGKLSSGERLAMAFKSLRKSVSKSSLGDFYRDKTLDFSTATTEGERNTELASILLGVLEVLLDSCVLDSMNQDSQLKRREAEQEMSAFLDLHDSMMQILNNTQGKPTGKKSSKKGQEENAPGRPLKAVRGPGRPPNPATQPQSKAAGNLVSRAILDKRKSFLSSTSMVYLLNSYSTHLQSRRANPPRSQSTSQTEANQKKETRAASYALQNCLRHLKAMAPEAVGQVDKPGGTPDTSWQLLISPILQIIIALKDSVTDAPAPVGDTGKEKGKATKAKRSDTEIGDGLMIMALKCLEELIKVATRKSCLVEVTRHMDVESNGIPEDDPDHVFDEEIRSPGEENLNLFEEAEAKCLHYWLIFQARRLLEELLSHACYSEIEVFCGIIISLGCKMPQVMMQKHGNWAHQFCKEKAIRNVTAARSLMSMTICLSPPPEDATLVEKFAAELLNVTGSDENEPTDRSYVYPMINKATKAAVGGILVQKTDSALVDLEWLVSKLKIQASSEIPQLDRKTPLRPGGSHRAVMEETLHSRMETIISVLTTFNSMSLTGGLAEQVLRASMHFYKCFAAATRLLIAPKGFTQPLPSTVFQRVADLICKRLTPAVYNFMSSKQRDVQEGAAVAKESVSQIKREGRTIPNLVFHIEECERYLLQLSKVSKVNLLRLAKRSTARDFRIQDADKKRKPQPDEDEELNEEDAGEGSDAEEEPPTAPDGTAPEEEEDKQEEEEEMQQEEEGQQEEEEEQEGEEEEELEF